MGGWMDSGKSTWRLAWRRSGAVSRGDCPGLALSCAHAMPTQATSVSATGVDPVQGGRTPRPTDPRVARCLDGIDVVLTYCNLERRMGACVCSRREAGHVPISAPLARAACAWQRPGQRRGAVARHPLATFAGRSTFVNYDLQFV